ncbi:hypothetical protein BKA64DRAFT_644944 [Cadophora sp. MPI-SDFR-AT-0126]|nr:hypothetical protein BKA64DRAFT_644944 [Leotiomycetes sp. MPI-SDFR-AT-0126]
MEGQLELWRSTLIEDTIDYLEDHEDYIVISIDKNTGDIIQQYEYEYSLDRFLEHLASPQSIPDPTSLAPRMAWHEGGLSVSAPELQMPRNEMKEGLSVAGLEMEDDDDASSRGGSPHTDPDYKDLDAISDPGSDGSTSMTYSDTASEASSEMLRERTLLYHDLEIRLGGPQISVENKHEVIFPTLPICPDDDNEKPSGVGDEGNEHEKRQYLRRLTDIGIRDGLALAATANAFLLACLWIGERWDRVRQE